MQFRVIPLITLLEGSYPSAEDTVNVFKHHWRGSVKHELHAIYKVYITINCKKTNKVLCIYIPWEIKRIRVSTSTDPPPQYYYQVEVRLKIALSPKFKWFDVIAIFCLIFVYYSNKNGQIAIKCCNSENKANSSQLNNDKEFYNLYLVISL